MTRLVTTLLVPYEQSPLDRISSRHGKRRSERDSAELVYILCGADNPKTWIIMRNFRFDTGLITVFDAGNGRTGTDNLLHVNLLLGNRQLLSNLRLVCSNH